MGKKQITLKDIAKALDISISTVSRALKDLPEISEETKIKVRKFAKEHKYKPNVLALGLRTNTNNTIGIIIPEIVHYFFSSVLSGMQEEAEKEDYNIIICQSNEDQLREVKATQILLSAKVCGILASLSKTTTEFDHFQEVIDNDTPLVFFDRICTGINTDKVVVDDYNGSYNATEYLISTGCKRIAFLGAGPNLAISNNRRMGYEDALRKHGMPVDKTIMPICDTISLAKEVVPELLLRTNRPDAFFAINDEVASSCINIIKSFGYHVPQDISVCGFTNGNIAEATDPSLTTVDQRGHELGTIAMELLIGRLKGKEKKEGVVNKIIRTKLIVRESTK